MFTNLKSFPGYISLKTSRETSQPTIRGPLTSTRSVGADRAPRRCRGSRRQRLRSWKGLGPLPELVRSPKAPDQPRDDAENHEGLGGTIRTSISVMARIRLVNR